MKKAQTEIIGLMVIVILFIFVGLIYIMFAGKESQESLTRDVTQSAKAQNMLDAFLQVTPCYTTMPYEQMDTIIKNCRTSGDQVCGEDCETLITDELEEMIAAYDDKQEYEFKIEKPDGTEFLSIGDECPGDTKVATDRVVVGGQALTLKLIYCV